MEELNNLVVSGIFLDKADKWEKYKMNIILNPSRISLTKQRETSSYVTYEFQALIRLQRGEDECLRSGVFVFSKVDEEINKMIIFDKTLTDPIFIKSSNFIAKLLSMMLKFKENKNFPQIHEAAYW